ncbi:UvrD-helicase domain-containing protein, partial [Phocaeicola dorei]
MKPTDTPNTQDGSIPTPGSYPLYEYPAYTFDKKYENDEFQKKVITLDSGYHLVLAPPGCGKTDILAERVVRALSCGVSLDDMLCLTFTNRAARGMRSRILERLQSSGEM